MRNFVHITALVAVLAASQLGVSGAPAGREPVAPFETPGAFTPRNAIDEAVLAGLRAKGIRPANPCSDAVFVRRVHVDLLGALPTPAEVLEFLADRRPDRRARLVDDLLARPEFADYAALRWCDVLRVKAEFPVNLWPNAVQAYHRWIRDAVRTNMPYDRFVRELLTSRGSNFRVPPVNFLRAVSGRDPDGLARATALTFLGARIETWSQERRDGLAAFFSRVGYKRTLEWKEELVLTTPPDGRPVRAVFPDGAAVTVPADEDPCVALADWMTAPGNLWTARVAVNRVWAWLLGRGIVHEPDDFRDGNPPSNPALLDALARELVLADFDLRHVYRRILDSATYQQSPVPRSDDPDRDALFGRYLVRPMDAEVLIDALCRVTGTTEGYWSATPEPYTFVPEERRTVQLSDGSVTSPFLELFGRPARDTGLWSERGDRPTDGQRLHLLNSSDIQRRIERSRLLAVLGRTARGDLRRAIRLVYLHVLSRPPTDAEVAAAAEHVRSGDVTPRQAAEDLVWALINSKEFLYRH